MRISHLTYLAMGLGALLPGTLLAADIQDVRIAFEHRKDAVAVQQVVTVTPGAKDAKDVPFTFPLPMGARDAIAGEEDGEPDIAIENHRVVVPGPIPEEGLEVRLAYRLPILDGVVALDQDLRVEIPVAHAAFVAAKKGIVIKGNGFSRSASRTTPDGVPALFIVAAPLPGGHIQILVTGFTMDRTRVLIILATVLSFGMLAVGFILWLRRTISPSSAKR